MREIILDIETTGLEHNDGHRIIEIGCIELNEKVVGANYHQYINPSKTLTENNIKIHGITNEYLFLKKLQTNSLISSKIVQLLLITHSLTLVF